MKNFGSGASIATRSSAAAFETLTFIDSMSRRSRSPPNRRRDDQSLYAPYSNPGQMLPPPPPMHHGEYGVRSPMEFNGQARGNPWENGQNDMELRRLKRLQLCQDSSSWSLWRNTPSPPPEARAAAAARLAAASKLLETAGARNENDKKRKKVSISRKKRRDSSSDESEGTSDGSSSPSRSPSPKRERKSKSHKDKEDRRRENERDRGPGPSAESNPLLQEQLLSLDKEEAALFAAWMKSMQEAEEEIERRKMQYEEDSAVVGPSLPDDGSIAMGGKANYGGALLPGEGDRMAAYVQSGKRIPRRGEVGLSSDQISKFETLGYVMSGSRHSRMNAVRIRKENQIYSAEEKAALAMFNFEENKRKEEKILEDMKTLVAKAAGGAQ